MQRSPTSVKTLPGIGLIVVMLWALPGLDAMAGHVYMQKTEILWRPYGKAVFDEAKRKNKPLYVFIHGDNCSWCTKFETETLETSQIRRRLRTEFIPVAVNFDKQKRLVKQLRTEFMPTSILLAPNGQKLLRFYGFIGPKALNETLTQVLMLWRQGKLPDQDFGDPDTCCPVPQK